MFVFVELMFVPLSSSITSKITNYQTSDVCVGVACLLRGCCVTDGMLLRGCCVGAA